MSREDDKRVAEILGWEHPDIIGIRQAIDLGAIPPDSIDGYIPWFTTDPSDDYKVLEWVRNKYDDEELREQFSNRLEKDLHWSSQYTPGSYSRALLALDEQGLLK